MKRLVLDTTTDIEVINKMKNIANTGTADKIDLCDNYFDKLLYKISLTNKDILTKIETLTDQSIALDIPVFNLFNDIPVSIHGVYYRDNTTLQYTCNKIISSLKLLKTKLKYKNVSIEETLFDLVYTNALYDTLNISELRYMIIVISDFMYFMCGCFEKIVNIDNVIGVCKLIGNVGDYNNLGKFIVFEGCDGLGKTTIIDSIKDKLSDDVIYIREPGSTHISERIRDILLDLKYKNTMNYITELLLYNAARSQLINEVIRPAIQSGTHIICSRYYYSTIVMQSIRDDLYGQCVVDITKTAVNGTFPDIVFSLYTENIGLIKERLAGKNKDRLESESISFFLEINKRYQKLDKLVYNIENRPNVVYVEADRPIDTVITEVYNEIVKIINE